MDQNKDFSKVVDSSNLATTLSMLLGLPIPFSSVGAIINDFYIPTEEEERNQTKYLETIAEYSYINLMQIKTYLLEAEQIYNRFDKRKFNPIYKKIEELHQSYQNII